MDPLTQGVLGAALPQLCAKPKNIAGAGLLGCLAGMSPDLDVLIRSSSDPLLFLEYHRHFTHSLAFIPFGGLICALLLYFPIAKRFKFSFLLTLLFCTLGYATHALLDACTSYGTLLLWPFSDARIAWNIISIIDPLFTLPLLLGVVIAAWRRRRTAVSIALLWCCAYMIFGVYQHAQAIKMGEAVAESRGHFDVTVDAKPSFANLVLWKTLYFYDGDYYVDAVRTAWRSKVFSGGNIQRLQPSAELPWLSPDSQQYRDLQRFSYFSDNYVALDPTRSNTVMDLRYSMIPNEIEPLWFIRFNPFATADQHVEYQVHRGDSQQALKELWSMLTAP